MKSGSWKSASGLREGLNGMECLLMKNVVLIGFMGTGKSVVARRVAARLGLQMIDTDREIEKVTGKSVAEIFAKDGPIRFRSEEALLVKKLVGHRNLVIATGGGMVLNPENVRLLRRDGVLIALTARPEVIYRRVKHNRNRPLLRKGDLMERIKELLNERAGVYDVAEYTVDTSDKKINEVVEEIVSYLKRKQYI